MLNTALLRKISTGSLKMIMSRPEEYSVVNKDVFAEKFTCQKTSN